LHSLDTIHLANALSGIAFVALGIWVLAVRVRSATNLAFGLFALAWAGAVFLSNLALEVDHITSGFLYLNTVLGMALVGSLWWLVSLHPTRLGRRDAPAAAVAIVCAFFVGLGSGILWGQPVLGVIPDQADFWAEFGYALHGVAMWGGLLFLALRWRALPPDGRRSVAVMSSALCLWPAYVSGDGVMLAPSVSDVIAAEWKPVLLAAIWLANASRDATRQARGVAWTVLGTMLLAMLERAAVGPGPDLWGYGVSRVVGVAILSYAIVRHQLLGVDVKARFAISKSTVAAAFIAVFFVASELAQKLFDAQLGGAYVGIVAAGGLVFAMAPLHRAAERLALKAVPATGKAATDGVSANEDAFRDVVRRFGKDGVISPAEELTLARVATGLGLSPLRAAELRLAELSPSGGARRTDPRSRD
jgi:hypothetical protein